MIMCHTKDVIDNDQVAKALLQYRNTPLPYIKLSPTQHLLYRNLCDHIPMNEKHYYLHQEWLSTATKYEKVLSKKHKDILDQDHQSWKELPEIPVGSSVLIHEPKNRGIHLWIKLGIVVDILPNQQYRIKCNHSGKITLRNRQFIKLIEQQTPSPTMSPGNNNVKPHQDVSPQQNNLRQPEINLPNDITKSNTEITPPTL